MSALRMAGLTRARTLASILVLTFIGLVVVGVVLAFQRHAQATDRHERDQVLQAVRVEVLALTGISASTTDEEIAALLAGMTPRLKGEFAPQADAFRQAMIKSKVQSEGRIIEIGLTTMNERRATAIVAAAARVSNDRTSGLQDRSYRLKLSLEQVAGRWLVDAMDFVP